MIFIPEPAETDDTIGRREEDIFSRLSRSTLPTAAAGRQFINRNLAVLPAPMQGPILQGLQTRWETAFFELVVARTLQILGSTLVAEQALASGRRPDFEATFPDGTVLVEATTPVIDREFADTIKRRNPLLQIVESAVPPGWRVLVDELPDIGHNESKRSFKQAVQEMLADLPPPAGSSARRHVRRDVSGGVVALTLLPGEPGANPIWLEPSAGGFSDAVERIRHAVDEKRSQVRQAAVPAILAINATGFGLTDTPEFDVALLGSRVAIADRSRMIVAHRFDPNGAFRPDARRTRPPTFAAALAYTEVGFRPSPEPILYVHPDFDGTLPEGLMQLERRTCVAGAVSVQVVPAKVRDVLAPLAFITDV
jgi:hypothetical protein